MAVKVNANMASAAGEIGSIDHGRGIEQTQSTRTRRAQARAKLPPAGTSALFCFVVVCAIVSGLQVVQDVFAASLPLTVLAGFLNAVLFMLLFTFIGNVETMMKWKTGWLEVAVAAAGACANAFFISRTCAAVTLLIAGVLLFQIHKLAAAKTK